MESQLKELSEENQKLREYIQKLETQIGNNGNDHHPSPPISSSSLPSSSSPSIVDFDPIFYRESGKLLNNKQIARFSRHLLLPEIGIKGQSKICNGSVLIVGLGGLGAPAALYLAAAGVGRLGFVDFDVVDTSNLHRQVIHQEIREGLPKVLSAKLSCLNLNASIQIDTYYEGFNEKNGLELVKKYDVVIDASDNVSTRYLVNDACVLAGKPLVSGCAVRFEGQLTVYNYKDGPCYRCLFPSPPPPETVTNCADGGVVGVVPGVIGCLQALEAQKILMEMDDSQILVKRMLLFSAKTTTFRNTKIRSRMPNCAVCGDHPTIKSLISYDNTTCGTNIAPQSTLSSENRITTKEFHQTLQQKQPHLLIDVRDEHQYQICSLPGAINIPIATLPKQIDQVRQRAKETPTGKLLPIYVMCRRGISSVKGTKILLEAGLENVKNVDGGVTAWQKYVDNGFPTY